MPLQVDHYGLHYVEGDIPLLVQEDVQHALDISMTFDVKVTRAVRQRLFCPHHINFDDRVPITIDLDHPLVQFFLPWPKDPGEPPRTISSTDESKAVIQQLIRLGTTNTGPRGIWTFSPRNEAFEHHLTNVMPWVVYATSSMAFHRAKRLVDANTFGVRRLLFMRPTNVVALTGMQDISADGLNADDLAELPLEQMGAQYLWERMRA